MDKSTAGSKRKYTLYKADDGRPDHLKPCAFHFSPAGCRNGAGCRFSHDPSSQNPVTAPSNDPKSASTTQASSTAKVASKPVAAPVSKPEPKSSHHSNGEHEKHKKKSRQEQSDSESDEDLDGPVQRPHKLAPPPGLPAPAPASHKHVAPVPAPVPAPAPVAVANSAESMFQQQLLDLMKRQEEMANLIALQQSQLAQQQQQQPSAASRTKVRTPSSNNARKTKSPSAGGAGGSKYQDEDDQLLFEAVNSVLGGSQASPSPLKHASSSSSSSSLSFSVPAYAATASSAAPAPVVVVTAPVSEPSTPVHDKKRKSIRPTPVHTSASTAAGAGAGAGAGSFTNGVGSFPAFASAASSVVTVAPAVAPALSATNGNGQQQPAKFLPAVADLVKKATLTWSELMELTRGNTRYESDYRFDIDPALWVASKPAAQSRTPSKLQKIIAIDCEMCQTEDPISGVKDHSALIRVSVVNGLNPEEVLLDKYVRPTWPITDMRTSIHGITPEDLKRDPEYHLRQAQADILALCSEETIIVGHGVQNDLKALKLDHKRVVDTAMIYFLADESNANCPSLRDVSEQVLGVKMQDTHHDSVEDARQALKAALYLMANGIPAPVVRKVVLPTSLFVHRIPESYDEARIHQMMAETTFIVPKSIEKITRSSEGDKATGKCHVEFASPAHSDLAFETIPGPLRPDKSNKPQKRVYLKGGGYICVRKV